MKPNAIARLPGVAVGVAVGVEVGVDVTVGVGVHVGTAVTVAVGVAVAVCVSVGRGARVTDGAGVGAVGVAVGRVASAFRSGVGKATVTQPLAMAPRANTTKSSRCPIRHSRIAG